MGEIADSLINGDFDFHTGEYIGRGHGIPRTKDKSLPWEKGKKLSKPQQGVRTFLHRHGLTDLKKQDELIEFYCSEQKIDLPLKHTIEYACQRISSKWQEFHSWYQKEIRRK